MNARVRTTALFLVLAGVVVLAGQDAPPPPQSQGGAPEPTFKTQVEYVEVDAVVTDQQGNFVRNLKKEDFRISEDGKPQNVTSFGVVDIPVERGDRPLYAARPVEPDVQSNERPFDGRVYVMILDDLHVDALRTPRVRQSARQFIERNLGANDLMAVIFTGGRSDAAQEFTSNKRLLLNAVDHFIGQKLPPPTISRTTQYARQLDNLNEDTRLADPDELERGHNAQRMLATLRQVADWFGGVRGRRKSMLWFSEGIDYDINNLITPNDVPTNRATAILQDIRDTVAATARANVSIYGIDPRGLGGLDDDAIAVESFPDQNHSASGVGLGTLANELRLSQDSLRWVSDESGGFAAVNRNDTTDVFNRIVRDNSSYYVLAYYPPSNKTDGKFHRIDVKVDRPGVTIRARRGYAAPRAKQPPRNTKTGGISQELFDAINSPLQVSGLTMRVFAAPFKGPQPNASVVVGIELSGRNLSLDPNSKVDISYLAVDAKSKVITRNIPLTMNLRPETRTLVEQNGVRVLDRIELPPGRYQLRAAARDPQKNVVGTVIYDLDVPDFYKEPMSMSGLTLTSMAGASMITARPDEQLKAVLPAPPVGLRAFPLNDELALFAEIYDNSGKTPHKVDIVTSVLTDEGKQVFKNDDERDSSELQGGKGGFGYTTRVPMSGLVPGSYVLHVEARSRLGNDVSVAREVRFSVVPAARAPLP